MNTAEDVIGEAVLELHEICCFGDRVSGRISEIMEQLEFGILVAESLDKKGEANILEHIKYKLEDAMITVNARYLDIHNLAVSLSDWQNERLEKS